MGLRETLNKNPAIATFGGGGIVVLALGFVAWHFLAGGSGGEGVAATEMQQYFTTDDGKSFFKDSKMKIAPFQKDGKKAYECRVYKCDGGQPFVGYLISFAPEVKTKIEAAIAAKDPEGNNPDSIRDGMMLVKAPNNGDDQKNWQKVASAQGATIILPKCPSGSGTPVLVEP